MFGIRKKEEVYGKYMSSIDASIREIERRRRDKLASYAQMNKLSNIASTAISETRKAGQLATASQIASKVRPYQIDLIRARARGDYTAPPKLNLRIKTEGALSILCLFGALAFISFNLTGMSIGNLSEDNFSLIGTGLFFLGLVFAFVFLKGKNKKK